MERLTKKNECGEYYYPHCFKEETCGGAGSSEKCNTCEFTDKVCDVLGHYEDAEECWIKNASSDRLTKYFCGYAHGASGVSYDKLDGTYHRGMFEATAIVERLAYYEDLKDSGRFLELPCAVGTPVYYIQGDCEGVPKKLMFVDRTFFDLGMIGKIGTEFFFTRESAEEALERTVDGNETD